jgi:hypothetical protein
VIAMNTAEVSCRSKNRSLMILKTTQSHTDETKWG